MPGEALLLSIGIIWPNSSLYEYMLPTAFGAAIINLVSAYIIGHLLQSLGNIFEHFYWLLWGGMPTDWPISKPRRSNNSNVLQNLMKLTGYDKPIENLKIWREVFGVGRAKLQASGLMDRAYVFNGNYGMFRGLTTVWLVLAITGWTSELNNIVLYPVLVGLFTLSLFRMHRFAIYYSREIFNTIFNLSTDLDRNQP